MFHELCERPQVNSVARTEGDLSLSYSGPEGSATFAATGVAGPDEVRLAVVNPLGETEASLRITNGVLTLDRGGRREVWKTRWRGVPIEFVPQLMLGRVPCPPASPGLRTSIADDELVVEIGGSAGKIEEFRYSYILEGEALRVRNLVWRHLAEAPVEVRFWDPDWRAQGQEHSLEVRWRRRKEHPPVR